MRRRKTAVLSGVVLVLLVMVAASLPALAQPNYAKVKEYRIERSILEGVIARGDRRIGDVIEHAWRRGARLDAWNEHFDHELWRGAFSDAGLDPNAIACRALAVEAPLPWSHIRCFRSEPFCADGRRRMLEALGDA